MPRFYGTELDLAPDARHGAVPVAGDPCRCLPRLGRRRRDRVAAPRERRQPGRARTSGRIVRELGVRVLPNTAGCHSVKEAVTTAHMAREVFGTRWIKLEVIGHTDTLQPDVFALVEAARILAEDGFQVFPYTTEDLVVAERLLDAGCEVLMPWGAPIGSGLGLTNPYGLRALRARFPDVPLVVDAGIGLPSHAAAAMEMGYRRGTAQHRRRQGRRSGGDGRAPSPARSRPGRSPAPPTRWSRATWPPPRRRSSARRSSNDARPLLPDLRQRRLDRPAAAARRPPGAAPRQGPPRAGAPHRDPPRRASSARAVGARLVVNDHWRLAIDEGCDFVHLGQEDLDAADLPAIRRAGLRARRQHPRRGGARPGARRAPDYVALGPVYPTILKAMKWREQGLDRVRDWKRRIGDLPLVAIGGLTVERAAGVFAAGADIVSVVTDITLNPDPEARVRAWIDATRGSAAMGGRTQIPTPVQLKPGS